MSAFKSVQVDVVRAYWDARPCNLRHSCEPVGTRAYFDQVEARKYRVEPHIPSFADFARWKGKRVLEIGCGIGTDTINFARAGAKLTAVDLSPKSLEIARARAEVFGLSDQIRFYCADAEELSAVVPIEQYDLVYTFGVIHHSPHPDRIVAQLRRYLAPGGRLKLMIYHRYSWKVVWIILVWGTANSGNWMNWSRAIRKRRQAVRSRTSIAAMKDGALSNHKGSRFSIFKSNTFSHTVSRTMFSTAMSRNGISDGCPSRCSDCSNECSDGIC